MSYTQANRPMRVKTALGEDALLLARLSGVEGVSMPFAFRLDLLSENAEVAADDVLRTPAAVTLRLGDDSERVVHGLVRRFVQLGQSEELTAYRAEIVPWLWFLSLVARVAHLPEPVRPRDRGAGVPRPGAGGLRAAAGEVVPAARVLRAVPRDAPGLRVAAAGGGGDLLLLRALGGAPPAGAGGQQRRRPSRAPASPPPAWRRRRRRAATTW